MRHLFGASGEHFGAIDEYLEHAALFGVNVEYLGVRDNFWSVQHLFGVSGEHFGASDMVLEHAASF